MPYTKLPRPEGHLEFSYSPMSPMNWNLVPFNVHIFVYRDVRLALKALLQAATTLQAQRLEQGTAALFSDHIYFRGHTDITHRLMPTRLRGPHRDPEPRQRFAVGNSGDAAREHYGDWFEEVEGMREIETSLHDLPDESCAGAIKSRQAISGVRRASPLFNN